MKHDHRRRLAMLGLVLILVTACNRQADIEWLGEAMNQSTPPRPALYQALAECIDNNPCGTLESRQPFFNLSGTLDDGADLAQSISLFVVPNATAESTWYVVDHCRPFARSQAGPSGDIRFEYIHAGQYVLLWSGYATTRRTPAVTLTGLSGAGYHLVLHHQENHSNRSILVFSIKQDLDRESPGR